MHENFSVNDDIQDITDYIVYFTQEKLNELKEKYPSVNTEDISIRFSSKFGRKLGTYSPTKREFTHNLNWINEHKDHPNFKQELDNHIIHEVAHVSNPDHTWRWKSTCIGLGYTNPTTTYQNPEFLGKAKYILRCPICAKEYKMYGKTSKKYVCNDCYSSHGSDALLISEKQFRMIKLKKVKKVKKVIKK